MSLAFIGICFLIIGVLLAFAFGREEGHDLKHWCETQGHTLLSHKVLMRPIFRKYQKTTPGMMDVTVETSNGEILNMKVEFGGVEGFRRIASQGAVIHEFPVKGTEDTTQPQEDAW